MSDAAWASAPSGRRLEGTGRDPSWLGEFSVLPAATPKLVALAASHWPQFIEDDLEFEGRRIRHRESGRLYRITTAYPFLGGDLAQVDVAAFVVRDGRLVLLREPGAAKSTSVPIGEVSGAKASGKERISLGPTIR